MARKEGGLGGCRKTGSQSQTGTRRLRRSRASHEKGTEVLAKHHCTEHDSAITFLFLTTVQKYTQIDTYRIMNK